MSSSLARIVSIGVALWALLPGRADAATEYRFPRPDLGAGHVIPEIATPPPEALSLAYLDVAVLAATLALASWLALKVRSRRGLSLLSVFTVLYFGFWRQGCICAVGSVQNVLLGLFDAGYAVPVTVLAFFFLPLLFTLAFGRTFCAAACPLGAIQDLVLLKPQRLPRPVRDALGLLPPLYLGLVVLFVATGAGFVLCRFEPFVPLFRLSGSAGMLATGGALLALGVFVARPWCRFLCPYGVLLGWTSRFSRAHLAITPAECVQCGLCEDACPFGAIRAPSTPTQDGSIATGRRRLAMLLAALPLLLALGAWLGARLEGPLSLAHPTVQLADEVFHGDPAAEPSQRLEAFRQSSMPASVLRAEANGLRERFRTGGALLGASSGLLVGIRLIGLTRRRRRSIWEPDRAECLSCGRCFASCPVDHAHRHGGDEELAALVERLGRERDAST